MNSLLDNSYKVSSLIWLENVVRLTFNAPITTKVVCFSRLLKCLRSLYGKQCGIDATAPGAVCSGSTVCFYSQFISNVRQLFAAEDCSRRHFQMHFFLAL